MKILGISGSLRKQSFNTSLLRSALDVTPEGVTIDTFNLAGIPLYNEDVKVIGFPPEVVAFRTAIRAADAVLIVTPEYNFSIPGVLKNAIDWASRPPDQAWGRKPIGIMGVSGAMSGTMRAQYHLRQVLAGVDAQVLTRPEVFVRNGAEKFDGDGRLTDETTREFVKKLIAALVKWANLINQKT